MKEIGKAMILPTAVAVVMGGLYLWRHLHVWPPGKEGWLEESVVMMNFHFFLLIVLLPLIVWSVACRWNRVGMAGRLALVAASLALLAATVIVPEIAGKRMERIGPTQASQAIGAAAPP